jgi:phospholipid transport system substrate-binding protein
MMKVFSMKTWNNLFKYHSYAYIFICMLLFYPPALQAKTDNYQEHISLIENLGKDAINTLTSHEISEIERRLRFEDIFHRVFEVEAIAKFVLGRYARRATSKEKQAFLPLFKKTISDIYAARFKNYNNERFEVTHARPIGDSGVRVFSKIIRPLAEPVIVEWKVYKNKKGQLRITDVIVERISMSMTQRSEFSSIIQKNGGTVSGLNKVLKQRLHS